MRSVTVVGCGIVGLTTALALQEKGWKVTLVAKEKFYKTLSHKVGAIWFPFEVHPFKDATKWGSRAYKRYQEELFPGNGVSFIPFTVVYDESSNTSWVNKIPDGAVRKAADHELPANSKSAYIAMVPLAEPPLYLPSLFQRFLETGGTFKREEISSLEQLAGLDFKVINCTGLGAKTLCKDDQLTAMRGQILRVDALNVASCVNSTKPGSLSYVIKRSTDCILGGTDYTDDWNLNIDPNDTDLILKRYREMGISNDEPIILEKLVGLRPKRPKVRFEYDESFANLFHNYGHGGAGFTVAWGCALELAERLELSP